MDLTRLGIPIEKLKSAGLLKNSQVPVIEQQQQQQQRSSSSTSTKKRRRNSTRDDEEIWSKKHKSVDRLSVSSSTSSSSSSSSSSTSETATTAAAVSSRVSFPLDRLNNNSNNSFDYKSLAKESFYHSPNSVDAKLTKIKREQNISPQKDNKGDVKSKIKQEKQMDFDPNASNMRNRSHSMSNSSTSQPLAYKDIKKKKSKGLIDESLNGTSSNYLLPTTNHDRIPNLVNGEMQPTTIIQRVFVSYFERNDDNSEQAEMR